MPQAWKEVIASSPTKPANTTRKRIEIPDSDNEEDDNYSGNEAEEDAAEAMEVDSDASGGSKSGARSSSVNTRVKIVLPELGSSRDDYDVVSENSISPDAEVVKIIRHNADFKGKLSYRAKFADGTEQNLPFDRLIEIEGGQKALHRFSSGAEDSGEDSDAADNLEDSENAEESETERSPDNYPRKRQSRRLKPQTKRSANNKASEDDSNTVRPMRRVRNTRGTPRSQSARLSNVDTGDDSDKGPSTRSTRHSTRSRGNPSTTDDDEDEEPSSKRLHRSAGLRDSLPKEDSEEEEDDEDEEQEEEEEPTRKRSQRATRSRRNPSTTDDSGEEPASKRPHRSTRLQGNSTRKEDTEAEDDEEPEESTRKRPQRTTRSKGPLMEVEMLGYKSGSDDEDNSVIVLDTSTGRRTVTVPAPKATRKTTRPRAKRKTREEVQTDDDISSEAEATRKSGRKRHKKTYVEPGLEDEFETVEIKKSTQPRVIHSKETFQVLDDNSDFVRIHNTQCATCGIKSHSNDRGQLICCQGCTATYHKLCLGHRAGREHLVTKIGEDNFVLQCKRCIGRQKMKDPLTASLDRCTACHEQGTSCAPFKNPSEKKKPTGKALDARAVTPSTEVCVNLINSSENILFRCIGCHRAWHYDHLVARGPKPSKKEKITDVRTQRIMQYKFDYKCTDCLKYEGKIVIVAWRPADKEHHIPGEIFELTDFPEDEREYLVKQEDESYFHVDWMPGPWVAGAYTHRKTGFSKGRPIAIFDDDEAIPESYLRIDIVFDVEFKGKVSLGNDLEADLARINDVESAYMKFIGLDYNEVFWDKPPEEYEEERYQDWKRAYEDYIRGFYVKPATRISQKIAQTRKINFKKLEIKEQPEYIKHGTLMKYQLNGLNWLYYKWHQGDNGILADEMGLGKTVQIVAFLSVLCEEQKIWPFLIIVPQATVPNWRREIQNWAPNIRVVVYAGTDVAKTIVRDYEMFHDNGDLKCHVVVTSYDTALSDAAVLRKIPWQGLVVDEGQRLKNAQSLLYQELSQWKFNHKVLLSGTPLQNNFRELFNLLHFIDPKEINAKELEEEYGDGNLTNENAPKMLELIKPYFLRRTKAEVLTHLPPMAEVIVPVSMSALQRKLYKSVLSKDTSLIRAILSRDKKSKQIEAAKLANLLMQLRKCVSHPFIYNKEIEERTTDDPEIIHRNLVEASSKLGLLNIMLPKLKERGHRVLIFSQFLDMLDVMEDFLRGHDLKYHRLDGKLKAMDKQKGIDEFNSADTETFAFLLSTRAGGVGINLATADTVIILDPDYNPFQDIQAISRAHRIGQKDKVLVFKIVTRDTVEEKIVQIGKKKLSLAHIITDKMNNSSDDNGPTVSDIESILSYGAKKLFEDDEDESVIKYDDKSIDKLLDRSHIEATKPTDGDGEIAGEQPFSFARVWANDKGELEEEDADEFEKPEEEAPPGFWERVLEEREEEARREAEAQREELGRGRRKRNVNYILQADKEDEVDNVNDSDFSVHNSESEESQSGQDGMPPTSYDVSMDMDLGPAPAPAAPPTGLLAQDKPKVKRSRKKVFQYQLEMDMDLVPTPSPGPPPGMPAMGVFPPTGPPPGQFPPGILPPGQFPPGQFPPGQFPPGQLPPGQFPPGQFPPGQFPPGAFPPGQFPPGQFPQGQLPPGQFPPGQFPPGQFPPGQFPPGVFPPGQFPPGQFPQGQFPPGQFPPGQFPPGQFPPGHLPPGQLPPNFQQPLQQPVQQQFTQAPPATPISAPAPAPQVTPAQPINQAPQASPYGSPYGLPTPYGVSSPYAAAPPAPLCAACALSHPPGFCPLKQQPIQQCYFCKIAHFAGVSNCPHFNDLQQIQIMLEVLDAPNVTYADGVVSADIEEARLFLKMRRDEVLKGLDDELKRIDGQKGQNVPGTGRPPGMVGQVVQTQQTQQAQRAAKAKGKEKEVAPPTPADPAPAPAQAQAVPNAHTQTAQPKGAGNEIAKAHAMAEEARKMAEQMRSQKLQASATPPAVPAQLANPAQPAQTGQPVQSSQKPVRKNAFTPVNGKPSMQIKDVSKETADRVKAQEQQKLKEREKKDAAGAEPNMPSLYRNTVNALKILKSASTSAAGSPAPETAAQAVAQEPEPRDSPGVGQLSQTAAQLAITEESRAQDQAKEKEKGKSKEQETDGPEVSPGKGKGKEVVENIAGKDVMVIDLDSDEEMGDGPGAQLFNEASAASSPHVMRKKRT